MAQGQHEELHSMLVGNRSVFSHLQFLSPTDAPLKGHPGSLRVSFHYQMVLMSNEGGGGTGVPFLDPDMEFAERDRVEEVGEACSLW